MVRIGARLFVWVGYVVGLVAYALAIWGMGEILTQLSQQNPIVAYGLAYLLALYVPALLDSLLGATDTVAFSPANLRRGLLLVALLGALHVLTLVWLHGVFFKAAVPATLVVGIFQTLERRQWGRGPAHRRER